MQPGGPVCQIVLSYRPPGWESIPGLLNRPTNTGSLRVGTSIYRVVVTGRQAGNLFLGSLKGLQIQVPGVGGSFLLLSHEENIRGGGNTVHAVFKGTQAWNFLYTFFAETETLWSQGPVTRDFWKSYSIRPRYSTFKHFRACSACDEIGSQYAQHAVKLVPRMLSVR